MKKIKSLIITIITIAILLIAFRIWIAIYPHILWFDNLGFSSVFWKIFNARILTGLAFALAFFVLAMVNISIARYLSRETRKITTKPRWKSLLEDYIKEVRRGMGLEEEYTDITPAPAEKPEDGKQENIIWAAAVAVISIFIGLSGIGQWEIVLKALNQTSFGILDPVFSKDIGFYVFSYPLLKVIQTTLAFSLFIITAAVIWIYFKDNATEIRGKSVFFARGVKIHLSALGALILLLFAWGYRLEMFGLLYSSRGVAFGASYTDVHAQLLGLNLEFWIAILTAILFLINAPRRGLTLPLAGVGVLIVTMVIMGGIYPAIMQQWIVKPNEITYEEPYIKRNIKFSRLAYGLDKVTEKEFAASEDLTLYDINRNKATIENIRLWDPRPLKKTYSQIQEIRLYYSFYDVDIDRYKLNGQYRQVMLSPREMSVEQLPVQAKTWVNEHLKYTHGYGLCLSPVNKITETGLPDLAIKDIPPVSKVNLQIERPEIYYGEETKNYVVVNTETDEFDYPKGDANVYTTYKGKGGVVLNSSLRKLAFAFKFSDIKLLLTGYITKQSRIMFNRHIRERVQTVAPFLKYDADPYMVIANKKLYWIMDAYTVTNLYPYSEPIAAGNHFNYIRNPVKVVIDAYDGSMTFYVLDEKDPLAKTYMKIFPDLFTSFSEMPKEIASHIRYPNDLFMIQAAMYRTYHMHDPQVFYNREDLWNIPREIYVEKEQMMDAYYVILKLPGEKKEEFMLMLPFTPANKSNMIAWLAARCDHPNYGKLIAYKFPKEKLIYGPMQIEARIDQQTEISQQFTLWGQKGSQVIRGNLLVIPIGQSFIYVEPVYLEAATGELPELKRVIVAYGNKIAMEENLEAALSAAFTGKVYLAPAKVAGESLKEAAQRALQLFNQAQGYLKQGNWTGFGKKLENLGTTLRDLVKK